MFQRRRLGLLTGLFLAVLALAPLVGRDGTEVQAVAAGDVVAQSSGEPVTLSGVIAETTSTLFETTTTLAPSTTTTMAPTTTVAPTTSAPPTTAAPTTAAPTTAPPTTAAPATTAAPTTTAAPPTTAAPATTASKHPCAAPVDNHGHSYSDPRSTQVWCDLAQCESGGNWQINTGNGYYGGLQFSLESWRSVGGSGYPHQHPAAEQINRGRMLQDRQGWDAWPHCSRELGLR